MLRRLTSVFTLLCLVAGAGRASSNGFDPIELQAAVQRVVTKALPATVAVAMSRRNVELGAFSGVIVSPEGHILTAGHAVDPGRDYLVLLSDGRRVAAKGLGRNESIDCGLIKITQPGEWPHVEMGCSATLKRNQPCVSLGHPGQYDRERGPVVRFGRIVEPVSSVKAFIQSTCLMEPGDSGGPLLDMNGRVIAIHSMVLQPLEQNYEVPVNQFRRYWKELNEPADFEPTKIEGELQWGMTLRARGGRGGRGGSGRVGGRGGAGLLVADVVEGGAAGVAGLKNDDRVTAIDGQRVASILEFDRRVHDCHALEREFVDITIQREGQETTVRLPIPRSTDSGDESGTDRQLVCAMPGAAPAIEPVPQLEGLARQFREKESRLDDVTALVATEVQGERRTALATLVSRAGLEQFLKGAGGVLQDESLLISKGSMVGDDPVVSFSDSRTAAATVIARDNEHDLVLLSVELPVQGGVELIGAGAAEAKEDSRGVWLLTPHPAGDGFVSVLGSPPFASARSDSRGFLGVMPEMRDGRVVLVEVIPDTAASRAKLEAGDAILRINDVEVTTPDVMIAHLGTRLPGDKVTVVAMRDDAEFSVDVVLGVRSETSAHIADRFPGGRSARCDGFARVFAHDAAVTPQDCGGPVFSLSEEFLGINIARASRARSYAVP
ncbi:MAG: PDZ domain-containing protein, partial [Planctomycetes bacterium]|nr:PDZ domain-containing protein [Planctomycetota bacterium]